MQNSFIIKQVIGATNWYIRGSILIQGLIITILAAFLSYISLFLAYKIVYIVCGFFMIELKLMSPVIIQSIFLDFIVISIIATTVGSIATLKKFNC